jgi:hypothetical protein
MLSSGESLKSREKNMIDYGGHWKSILMNKN